MVEFILASASPRRKDLLEEIGVQAEIIPSDADESMVSKTVPPGIYVQELALIKASDVAKKTSKRNLAHIIAADTIVYLDGNILGKPKDKAEAVNILKNLSGKIHEVYTGYCVMRLSDGFSVCKSVKTEVTFKELDEDTIKRYVATGEPMDKAGAYGIQGIGAALIDKIDGDYPNVVGLPISPLFDTLKNEFNINII